MVYSWLLVAGWLLRLTAVYGVGWKAVQRVQDAQRGQNHYLFGERMSLWRHHLLVGSVTSRMHKGHARVYWNPGDGFVEQARLVDPDGAPMDNFGSAVALSRNATYAVVGAPDKGRGAVFVYYRRGVRGWSKWDSGVALEPRLSLERHPLWFYGTSGFGKSVAITQDVIAVGSHIHRPGQTATNIPGTKAFLETLNEENYDYIPNDYVLTFARTGDNAWEEQDFIQATDDNSRIAFGRTLALTPQFLLVGASSRLRIANNSKGGGFGTNDVGGWIYVFETNGTRWTQIQQLRPDNAYFIGHSLAVDDDAEWLAFGSEWFDRHANNTAIVGLYGDEEEKPDSVYIYRRNATNHFHFHAEIHSPPNATRFGTSLSMSNETLVVGAPGDTHETNMTTPGHAFIYHLVGDEWELEQQVEDPLDVEGVDQPLTQHFNASDYFGESVALYGETLVVSTRGVEPSALYQNPYLSRGAAVVWRNIPRPIDAASCTVACQYPVMTANTTNNCVLHSRDALGWHRGQQFDASKFTVTVVGVDALPTTVEVTFAAYGEYTFTFMPYSANPTAQLDVQFESTPIGNSPYVIDVTEAVWQQNTTFVCNDTVPAGFLTTCTIHSYSHESGTLAGLPDATPQFDVHIYNIDVEDYEGVTPTQTTWTSTGHFEFSFIPPEPGVHAVLVKYNGTQVAFPNPYFVSVIVPEVEVNHTTVDCASPIAPLKNASCIVTLRGGQSGALAGMESDVALLNVTLSNNDNPIYPIQWTWLSTGKVRFLFTPLAEGTVNLEAKYEAQNLRNMFDGSITVATTVRRCSTIPQAAPTLPVYIASFRERNNATVFKNEFSATNVQRFVDQVCEDVPV